MYCNVRNVSEHFGHKVFTFPHSSLSFVKCSIPSVSDEESSDSDEALGPTVGTEELSSVSGGIQSGATSGVVCVSFGHPVLNTDPLFSVTCYVLLCKVNTSDVQFLHFYTRALSFVKCSVPSVSDEESSDSDEALGLTVGTEELSSVSGGGSPSGGSSAV